MINYRRLTIRDRIKISVLLEEKYSLSEIAKKLGRNKSTISREVARCRCIESYNASLSHHESHFNQGERRRGLRKLDSNLKLRDEVFEGLRKRWSPDQISKVIRRKYPKDFSMRISHEAIYTYIYVLGRGELKNELVKLLRQRRKYRRSEKRGYLKRTTIPELISIEERPKSVEKRSLPGHWEGDLIIGKGHKSALGTLVERKTRALILVPINGPNHSARVVRKAFEKAAKTIPKKLRVSLTYDRGTEMCEHKLFTKNSKMKVYFCHPSSPWQRGTCENTNGLIRDYFPKGTDFSKIALNEIKRVQDELNERPRRALDYRTPKEVFEKEILKLLR